MSECTQGRDREKNKIPHPMYLRSEAALTFWFHPSVYISHRFTEANSMTTSLIGGGPIEHPNWANQRLGEIDGQERRRYYKRNTVAQMFCAKTRISVWNRLLITLHNKRPAWGENAGDIFAYQSEDLFT